MDPTTVFCPNGDCDARGQIGQGNSGIHARTDRRCICQECQKPFSATPGTAFDCLRTAAETVRLVVTLLAHGCPLPAMVAALGFAERTVAAWWARSGRQGQAVPASRVAPPRDLGHVPADALRGKKQGGSVWRALAMRVKTRRWLGGDVSEPRDLTRMRRLLGRGRCCALPRPRWVCPDGLGASIRAMREPCRDPVRPGQGGRPRRRPWRNGLSAPVGKRDARRRGGATERRLVAGTPARVEPLRRRSPGDGVSKTASSARLHATCRERLAPLARRGRVRARHTLTRHEGLCLVGPV
jgi:hypothetical protein